jgi:hypothetical protein
MGIFDIELDGIIIPIFQAGGTLTFFPDLASATMNDPDPYPFADPLDSAGGNVFTLFPLEKTMRAINERLARHNLPTFIFPNRMFNAGGFIGGSGEAPATQLKGTYYVGAVGNITMPVNGFYGYDLGQWDAHFSVPAGTRGAELVNDIRTAVDLATFSYIRNISSMQGATDILYYDTAVPSIVPPAATPATYKQRLAQCRTAIRLFEWVNVDADWATIITPNSHRRYWIEPWGVEANARACIVTNYPLAPDGNTRKALEIACAFQSDTPAADAGFGFAGGDADADHFIYTTNRATLSSPNIVKYPAVQIKLLFTQFLHANSANEIYFPPSQFGSPAINTYVLLSNGTNFYTLTQAQVQADVSGIVALLDPSAPVNSVGWFANAQFMAAKLGPFTYNV